MVALTDAINKMPYVPGRIGQLGLFREQGVSTTSVMIEEREGSLNLVETTARGAPAIQNTTNKRKARSLVVPHIALEDTILADEVQNVRAFGSESMLEGVQAVVNQRMSEMATKMDATLEHLRIGAIKGQILDADGSAVTFELRASEVANPRPSDQLTVGGDTFVIQGEPERRDPDRLVWSLAVRAA